MIKNKLISIINNTSLGRVVKKILVSLKDKDYLNDTNEDYLKRIYVSYLTEPFRNVNNTEYLNKHQNRRETIEIAEILNKLGFSYRFVRFDKIDRISNNYDVVFGLEPNFVRACNKNPNALKVYYATGAYWEHQNNMIIKRTEEFNKKHGTKVLPSRLVIPHKSVEISDSIIQIGSKYTVSTYPVTQRYKITTIRQTCHDFKFPNFIERKMNLFNHNEYVWMGSGGSILKGLDLVIDYFLEHDDKKLHIVGPIDSDVYDYYAPLINKAPNIINHGFLDLDSKELEKLALTSTFVIMPSGSEGGCPGAVINMAKLGCIPIVSKYAAYDGIEDISIFIKELTDEGIDEAITEASSYDLDKIKELIKKNADSANSNFNMGNFKSDFENSFMKIQNNFQIN